MGYRISARRRWLQLTYRFRKYGTVDQQLRALTVLDGLIENAGSRFQRGFADEPLLERLRVCATDSLSDEEVKKKCAILFQQWAIQYKSTPGMERLAALHKQLPKRKKAPTQAQSKVLKETEPSPNEDPFGNDEDDEAEAEASSQAFRSPQKSQFGSPLSSPASTGPSLSTPIKQTKDAKMFRKDKKGRSKAINMEKEKPQILQSIASASIASVNLINALKLIDREHKRVSEDPDAQNRFEICKGLRRQILRYIQHIESEQWLGSLIQANDSLVEALMAFEVLDKSVDDDSDSEGEYNTDPQHLKQPPAKPPRPEPNHQKNLSASLGKMHIGMPPKAPVIPPQQPAMTLNGTGPVKHDEDEDSQGEDDEDDPFADSNAVHTPKVERPGMTW